MSTFAAKCQQLLEEAKKDLKAAHDRMIPVSDREIKCTCMFFHFAFLEQCVDLTLEDDVVVKTEDVVESKTDDVDMDVKIDVDVDVKIEELGGNSAESGTLYDYLESAPPSTDCVMESEVSSAPPCVSPSVPDTSTITHAVAPPLADSDTESEADVSTRTRFVPPSEDCDTESETDVPVTISATLPRRPTEADANGNAPTLASLSDAPPPIRRPTEADANGSAQTLTSSSDAPPLPSGDSIWEIERRRAQFLLFNPPYVRPKHARVVGTLSDQDAALTLIALSSTRSLAEHEDGSDRKDGDDMANDEEVEEDEDDESVMEEDDSDYDATSDSDYEDETDVDKSRSVGKVISNARRIFLVTGGRVNVNYSFTKPFPAGHPYAGRHGWCFHQKFTRVYANLQVGDVIVMKVANSSNRMFTHYAIVTEKVNMEDMMNVWPDAPSSGVWKHGFFVSSPLKTAVGLDQLLEIGISKRQSNISVCKRSDSGKFSRLAELLLTSTIDDESDTSTKSSKSVKKRGRSEINKESLRGEPAHKRSTTKSP
jgi:hypothetical protein